MLQENTPDMAKKSHIRSTFISIIKKPHFYDKSLGKYICLIFLPHFTTQFYCRIIFSLFDNIYGLP